MKWFRFYSDALDDPKVQRLPGDLFKTWVNLLCLAAKDDGCLPSTEDIAFALRLSDEQAASAIAEFTKRGLLDSGEDGMTPHNWQGRQPVSDRDPTATERQQRRRSRIASENVTDPSRVTTETVTPLDKIRLEESREEKKRTPPTPSQGETAAKPPRPRAVIAADGFDDFYGPYPRHDDRQDAVRQWNALSVTDRQRAISVLPLWAACEQWENPRYVPQASTFLHKRRFDDEVPRRAARASPNGVAEAMNAADYIWAKHEEFKNGASNGTGDVAIVHGGDQGGIPKARVQR